MPYLLGAFVVINAFYGPSWDDICVVCVGIISVFNFSYGHALVQENEFFYMYALYKINLSWCFLEISWIEASSRYSSATTAKQLYHIFSKKQ